MKRKNKILIFLVSAALIFAPYYVKAEDEVITPVQTETEENNPSESPAPSESPTPSESPVTYTITLDKSTLELEAGKTANIKATVTPSSSETVVWSSSDTSVATVDSGNITALKEGTTTITATLGDVKATCTVTVTAKQTTKEKSNDATLKSLTISNGTLSTTFKSNVYEYTVTISENVSSLKFTNLNNDLSDSKAGVQAISNSNLKTGSTVKILVTAEDGKTNNTYILKIVKESSTSSLNLKSLKINGYALNETFDSETLSYTASIPYEIDTITVLAAAEDEESTVSVKGDTNLKVGKNTVVVTVTDSNGKTRKYEILVTRETEESLDGNPTSIITSSNSSNSTSSSAIITSKNTDSDNFLKYAIVSLACLILFAIGGIGIYFYLKTSPKKLKKEIRPIHHEHHEESHESPVVEVINDEKTFESVSPVSTVPEFTEDDFIDTKEFKPKEKVKKETDTKIEDLFDELFDEN